VRVLLLIFFVLAALSLIFSGVLTLLARWKLPDVWQRRLLVSALFRIAAGMGVLVVVVDEIANPS
jgi:hypothetical protein